MTTSNIKSELYCSRASGWRDALPPLLPCTQLLLQSLDPLVQPPDGHPFGNHHALGRMVFSLHTFPLFPSGGHLFSVLLLSFHFLRVSYFCPSLSLVRPAVLDRPPIFAVNHVRPTWSYFKYLRWKHSEPFGDFWAKMATGCPLTRWGGALSSGSTVSLSSICRRCAFFRCFRCRLPFRWSKKCSSPLNIILQMWHSGNSIVPNQLRVVLLLQ